MAPRQSNDDAGSLSTVSPALPPAAAGQPPPGPAGARGDRPVAATLIVLAVQLVLVLNTTAVNVVLPQIDRALSFGPASLSWVLNSYTLAFGALLLTGGRLGDVLGRLRVLMVGLAVFAAASLLAGLATSSGVMIAARAVQGVGAALAAPGVLALLVTNAVDEVARNRALGYFSAVSVGGGTIGLLLGGVLADLVSWRWVLLVNVPLTLAVLAVIARFVDDTARRPGRFDLVGALAAAGAAVAVVDALIEAPSRGWGSTRTVAAFALGALLLVVLVVTERAVAHPMLRPALLRDHQRVGALIVATLVFGAQFSMFFLLVQYLQIELGYGPLGAGLAFLPLTVVLFAVAQLAPRLVGRYGQAALLAVGTAGLTLSFVWLAAVVSSGGSLLVVLAPTLLLGAATGITFMPATSLVMRGVETEHAGSASGLNQSAQQLGGAIGLAVIVSVYASYAVPGRFTPGTGPAFITAAALSFLALLVVAVLVRSTHPARTTTAATTR